MAKVSNDNILAVVLALSFLLSLIALPISGDISLRQEKRNIPSYDDVISQMKEAKSPWGKMRMEDIKYFHGRMEIEARDYSGESNGSHGHG